MNKVQAALIVFAALGTMPAVGGYSDAVRHAHSKGGKMTHSTKKSKAHGDFTTVGIVSRMQGKAFVERKRVGPLGVGQGVWKKDSIWVDRGALLELIGVKGSKVVIVGPAAAVLGQESIHIYNGSYWIDSGVDSKFALSHGKDYLLSGIARGRVAVWATNEEAQALCLKGEADFWNPAIDADKGEKTAMVQGTYVASSTRFKHLQLTPPRAVDVASAEGFLARFGEGYGKVDAGHSIAADMVAHDRAPASVVEKKPFVGSRAKKEVVEPVNQAHMDILRDKLWGKNFEEDDDGDALAAAGTRVRERERGGGVGHDRAPASFVVDHGVAAASSAPHEDKKPSEKTKKIAKELQLSPAEKRWLEKLRKGRN